MSIQLAADERHHDLAHLGRQAIFTPTPDATVDYFVNLIGMDVVQQQGGTTYLRTFDDYENWTLKVTAAERAGVDWVSWRVASPHALRRRVAWLERVGFAGEWTEDEFGVGEAYCFRDPDGHAFRLYYDTERYVAPERNRPALPTNVGAFTGRGANARRFDHVNLLARNVRECREFWDSGLGLRSYEIIKAADGEGEVGAWMSSSFQGHELIYTQEHTSGSGRLHHLAYVVDSREDVLRAASMVADAGIYIEAGPSQHTAIQGFYLYMREPGGNRIELAHGGYFKFAPDEEPYVWSAEEWKEKPGWGARIPPEFHIYGTPDVGSHG